MNDREKIVAAVDWFASEMKAKLLAKADAGWTGWDDPIWTQTRGECSERLLSRAVEVHTGDVGQAVDTANFAMFMAWAHKQARKDQGPRAVHPSLGLNPGF